MTRLSQKYTVTTEERDQVAVFLWSIDSAFLILFSCGFFAALTYISHSDKSLTDMILKARQEITRDKS